MRESAGVYLDGHALEFRGEHATVTGVVAAAVAHLMTALDAQPVAGVVAGYRLDLPGLFRGDELVVALTPSEVTVMRMLMAQVGHVVQREAILKTLYRDRLDEPFRDIVTVFVSYIRAKLRKAGVPFRIETVRGFGYCLRA